MVTALARPTASAVTQETELGPLPADWHVARLGELCTFENGDRGFNYPSKRDFTQTGIPFVNAGHLRRGRIDFADMDYISQEKFNSLGGGRFTPGDVLFCLRGSLGKFAEVEEMTPIGAVASSLVIIRPNEKKLTRGFLNAYCGSEFASRMIGLWAGGAAQPNLGAKDLARFVVPLPPTLKEQEAIARALSDANGLIEGLERLVVKKSAIKQGAMQELLSGRRRLAGFSDEWQVRPLGKLTQVIMGQSPPSASYNRNGRGLPLIQGNADIIDREAIKRIFTSSPSKIGVAGDVLLSVRAPVGEVSRTSFDICLGRGVCALRGSDDFIFHALVSLEPSWSKISKGSTFDSINSGDVAAFSIPVPLDPVERQNIANVLNSMDAGISALNKNLAKARLLKQGMMQELLTGRVRLV